MARTLIVATVPSLVSVAANPVAVDASVAPNGMNVKASPHLCLRVITTGTVVVLTIQTNAPVDGNALTAPTVTMPATGTQWVLLNRAWMTQSDGTVWLNFSVATGATVEAIDMGA